MDLAQALANLDDVCRCGANKTRNDGFTHIGADWVCGRCRKPTRMYTQNVILPRILKEHGK